ncbi:MAG: ORF6N domain-containing protein [Bacteroidetes bacterium]|nr:MAG: ORF6N domain-containing protein [Bacteroidota bacterium]
MKALVTTSAIDDKDIVNKIYTIRGQRVMLDRDLANMYDVETKRLKEQVNRNLGRFPDDFMFQLTADELANWRSQFATSNADLMGLRHAPFAFTEQGVAMLSSVLRSERAIQVNIQIIRVYTRTKQLLVDNKEIYLKLEKLELGLMQKDKEVKAIFEALRKLLPTETKPRNEVGFLAAKKRLQDDEQKTK